MKNHPFVAGMTVAFCAIALLAAVGLLLFPELIYIYRAVNAFFSR